MKFSPVHYEAIEKGGSVLTEDGEFVTTVARLRELDENAKEPAPAKKKAEDDK